MRAIWKEYRYICTHMQKFLSSFYLWVYIIFSYIWESGFFGNLGEKAQNQMSNKQAESGFLSLRPLHFCISGPKGS